MSDENKADSAWLDYKNRLVFSLLKPAIYLASKLLMSLDDFLRLAEMAYFEQERVKKGRKLKEIAHASGKSLRAINYLQERFKKDFFAPEREVALRRNIAVFLSHHVASLKQLKKDFSNHPPRAVEAAVADLVRAGKIIKVKRGYARNKENETFFSETDVLARVDGLNRQMEILAESVWHKWIESRPTIATGRSFVFNANESELQKFMDQWIASLRQEAAEMDQRAQGSDRFGVTLAVGPIEKQPEDEP